MFPIKTGWRYVDLKKYDFIGISTYDQTYLQLFMWNNGERKIIHNIYKLVFVIVRYRILNLTYDHRYSQLLVLNYGKRGVIYDN